MAVLQERNKQLEELLKQERELGARQASRIEELLVENARLGGGQKRRRPGADEDPEPAAQRQRVGGTADKLQTVENPTPSGLTFVLKDFQMVGQAWAAYLAIENLPRRERRWRGDTKARTKHCTAFGRFRDGLAAQIKDRGVEALEEERLARFLPLHRNSALQRQANFYLAK